MPNVNQPVAAIDPTTNYYGELKKTNPAIERALTKGFDNSHANLLNEGEEETTKATRITAMRRRLGFKE